MHRRADLAIVAVKAFDLEAALATTRRWPGAAVLTTQNGVGAEAVADAWIPYPAPLLAASLTTAVEPADDGVQRLRTGGIGVAVVRDDEAGAGARARRAGSSPRGTRAACRRCCAVTRTR